MAILFLFQRFQVGDYGVDLFVMQFHVRHEAAGL